MSARRGSCKIRNPDSSEPETRIRQKQESQPRCPAADKSNGTRRGANKKDLQKEKSEKPPVERGKKNTKCFIERAGNSTEGTVDQITQTRTKSTKKSEKKTKEEDHNSVEGAVKSPETTRRVKTPEEAGPKMLKAKSKRREETSSDMKEMSSGICTTESGEANNERKAPKTAIAERSNKEEPKEDSKMDRKPIASSEEEKVDLILKETLEKIKLKMKEKANVATVINDIKKHIIKHLREKTKPFKEVQEPLNTGSYYENTKISDPDEFDVMLPLLVERVHTEPFKEDGAFYKVALKRGNNPLKDLQKGDFLPASTILTEFRKEVNTFLKDFKGWKMTPTKSGCPAVTLTTEVESIEVSLDLVLCLQVKSSWPDFTKDGFKIETWLGGKTKQEHKRKSFYLVPKYEGKGSVEHDGFLNKDGWRISFSHIEKEILRNHGSTKTCCEKDGEKCCRKACLKLLKYLLHLLKERDSSLKGVCSYHAKTTLLHACCDRKNDCDWKASDLRSCFLQLLQDFEGHLNDGQLNNFFVPKQNLLHGISKKTLKNLAKQIEEQRSSGFPIFCTGS